MDKRTRLIAALRATAARLRDRADAPYTWSHQGACNCGHLAQTITHLDKATIHRAALKTHTSDWSEHALAFCPASELPIDHILQELFDLGLTRHDIVNLERLRDPDVLAWMGAPSLDHRQRENVVRYLNAWAEMLETLHSARLPTHVEDAEERPSENARALNR